MLTGKQGGRKKGEGGTAGGEARKGAVHEVRY